MDQDKKDEKVEWSLVQYCLSGETNGEKNRRVQDQQPGQGSLSGERERERERERGRLNLPRGEFTITNNEMQT